MLSMEKLNIQINFFEQKYTNNYNIFREIQITTIDMQDIFLNANHAIIKKMINVS